MTTYLLLNIIFITAVCLILRLKPHKPSRAIWYTLGVLLMLTAVFDNLLIVLSIIDYNPEKLLGIAIYKAPIEDFMYVLLVVILIPAVWHKLGDRNDA